MLKRLYRQRRRFFFGSVAAFLGIIAGAFAGIGEFDSSPGDPIFWVAAALSSALVMGALVLALTYILPDFRFIIEIGLVTLAAEALLRLGIPGAGPTGALAVLFFVSLYVITERLLYGAILDPVTCRALRPRARSFHTDRSPEAAWAALVPLPENLDSFYYPGTTVRREDGPGCYLVSYVLRYCNLRSGNSLAVGAVSPCRGAPRRGLPILVFHGVASQPWRRTNGRTEGYRRGGGPGTVDREWV